MVPRARCRVLPRLRARLGRWIVHAWPMRWRPRLGYVLDGMRPHARLGRPAVSLSGLCWMVPRASDAERCHSRAPCLGASSSNARLLRRRPPHGR